MNLKQSEQEDLGVGLTNSISHHHYHPSPKKKKKERENGEENWNCAKQLWTGKWMKTSEWLGGEEAGHYAEADFWSR